MKCLTIFFLIIASKSYCQLPIWYKSWYDIAYRLYPSNSNIRTQSALSNVYYDYMFQDDKFNTQVSCNGNSYHYMHARTNPTIDSSFINDTFYYIPDIIIFSLNMNGQKRFNRHLYMPEFSVNTFDFKIDNSENIYFIGKVKADSIINRNDSLILNNSKKWHSFLISLDSNGNYRWSLFIESNQFQNRLDNGILAMDILNNNELKLFGYFKDSISILNQTYTTNRTNGSNFIVTLNKSKSNFRFTDINNLLIYNRDSYAKNYNSHFFDIQYDTLGALLLFSPYQFIALNDTTYTLNKVCSIDGQFYSPQINKRKCFDCNNDTFLFNPAIRYYNINANIIFNNSGIVKYKYITPYFFKKNMDTIIASTPRNKFYKDNENNVYFYKTSYLVDSNKLSIKLISLNYSTFIETEILELLIDTVYASSSIYKSISYLNGYFELSIDAQGNKFFIFTKKASEFIKSLSIKQSNGIYFQTDRSFIAVISKDNKIIEILDQFSRIEAVKCYPRDSFLYFIGYNVMGHDVSLLYDKVNIGFFKDSVKFYAYFQQNILPSNTKLMQWTNQYIAKYKNPYLNQGDSFTFCDSFYIYNGKKIFFDTVIKSFNYNPEYPYCNSIVSDVIIKKYNSPIVSKKSLGLNCDRKSINISSNQQFATKYLWSTGDTSSSINLKNIGLYILNYNHPCGLFNDSFKIVDSSKIYIDSTNTYSCTPYTWQGSIYTKSEILRKNYKSIRSCDSIIILDLKIGLNNKVNLTNGINYTAQQDNVSYQWYRCNPWRRITNETKRTFTTTTKGSYAVVLDNGKGCSDTSDCIALYSSGFATTMQRNVAIYPNPFNNHLTIELERIYKETNIKIYDLTGRQILNNNYLNRESIELDLKEISKGTYYLQIETDSETLFFNILKD